jgi:Isochorismatase family
MPQYPAHYYAKFVELAQGSGSGLGRKGHLDGALKALGRLLNRDSSKIEIVAAIAALGRARDGAHISKLRKYREAVAFLENTFPISPGQRQAPVGAGVEAIRYVQNATRPTATFTNGHLNYGSLQLTQSTAQIGLEQTVTEYIEANAANTRLLLIHLGGHQGDMNHSWEGATALDHMNAVLTAAAEKNMHVCILRDPHTGVRGQNVPTPTNAVCAGLRNAVGGIPGTHIWVADGGNQHSAFHDPAFQIWVTNPGVNAVIVMGFDADICVRGNVFGISEQAANVVPLSLVPALINFVDVVTSRPLLSGGAVGTVQSMTYWGNLVFMKAD